MGVGFSSQEETVTTTEVPFFDSNQEYLALRGNVALAVASPTAALVLSKHKVERIGQILGSGLTTVEDSTAALLLAATEAYTSNNVCKMSSCA